MPLAGYIGHDAEPTTDAAPGIWTLRQAELYIRKGQWPAVITPFSPATITGLQAWWDASDTSTITESSGSVSQVDDKSGNSNHLTQSTGSSQPSLVAAVQNGLSVLRFDGSNDYLSHNVIVSDPTELTLICVVKSINGSLGNIWSHRDEATRVIQLNYAGNPDQLRFSMRGSGNALQHAYVNTQLNTFATFGFVFNKTASNHFSFTNKTKGTAVTAAFSGENFTSTLNTLGASYYNGSYSGFFEGDICEVVIYNTALSDADREAVEDYLIAKWGITP